MSQSFSNNINSLNTTVNVTNTFTVADDRYKILAWLSPLDPRIRHQDIRNRRVENVGGWILRTEEFRSWYANSSAGGESHKPVLLCHGDPGVGKTFIRYQASMNGSKRASADKPRCQLISDRQVVRCGRRTKRNRCMFLFRLRCSKGTDNREHVRCPAEAAGLRTGGDPGRNITRIPGPEKCRWGAGTAAIGYCEDDGDCLLQKAHIHMHRRSG